MKFRIKPAPFLKNNKQSTRNMMWEFSLVLVAIWIVAIVMNFVNLGSAFGVKAILLGLVAIATGVVIDLIVALITKKNILKTIIGSYSYVSALILVLILPISVSYYAIIIGMIFAVVFGKIAFGGFGHNIVNPAGLARIVISICFALPVVALARINGLVDATSGATVTTAINWASGDLPANLSLSDLFFGKYYGSMGETCTLAILVAGIYLIIRKIIDYRLAVSYVVTAFIIALVCGLAFGVDNAFNYAIVHLLVGGLAFGAVFMVTDPVTTPTSPMGKIIFGIGAAAITMLIRICGNLPEGVVYSIVFMNLLVPVIDSACIGVTKTNVLKKWLVVIAILVVAVGLNVGIAFLGGVV